MTFHHTGCLVEDMEAALERLAPLSVGPPSEIFTIAKQSVKVCFLPLGGETFLELVCPAPEAQGLQEMLKQGQSFYHLAFKVPDIDDAVDGLTPKGYSVITCFFSEAFEGALCAFLKSSHGELIELIQEKG